ncbi:UTP-glucose-1-phosphate uridylyltransferase [Alloalcanivorax dieselolei B5]|uniref:UTP--glucose-1-phosphate uridylyltransferase n=1 Tax=Alcanivorax dieselolei (strain DSM 16502 / CGMCC 1.3690 / MCCC 1A00001 / B-5) TaxID=930169 RepID=K0CBL4_ALCDB|nr:UTP--glucose-1-phosphate uridylyltransferase [Alloalcanivorax dieselolei]AFT70023.1 UTP-glucose-1-phosphate uridylyltransferase [Alloalcanivorax dieselolei B5]GGK09204.1 UTP--glucose-1-phosphate uridylyltransferase [Alloalcanivorax dieselolei]
MISKAVIPVAGLGTRMLPASKSIPKEMLPIVDRPAIHWVVEEAVQAGITEIILVNHAAKGAIEDYFDINAELDAQLQAKGKESLRQSLRHIIPENVSVISVRQREPLGLGHAVLQAAPVVGAEPFVVMLPDVLVDAAGGDVDLKAMIRRYQTAGAAQIMVEPVPMDRVNQYGVVSLEGAAPEAGGSAAMTGVVEKPAPEDAPSNLSVVGRYVLPGAIMELLKTTRPGAGGEIQLTDAIAELIGLAPVEAYAMTGKTFDCGNKAGYLEAFIHFALEHPELAGTARSILERHHAR